MIKIIFVFKVQKGKFTAPLIAYFFLKTIFIKFRYFPPPASIDFLSPMAYSLSCFKQSVQTLLLMNEICFSSRYFTFLSKNIGIRHNSCVKKFFFKRKIFGVHFDRNYLFRRTFFSSGTLQRSAAYMKFCLYLVVCEYPYK